MKRIERLRELQLVGIYIYKELVQFCNQHGIRCYLHGGSLIGAIRHKGFIPWDDDIDVCMSRPDYEKMLALSGGKISEHCSVIDPSCTETFNGYIPVVVYDDSKMLSGQYRTQESLKIGVSIFVYDGITGNRLFQKVYYGYMFLLRAKHALCRANFDHVNTKVARRWGPIFQRFFRPCNVGRYKRQILALQQKYAYGKSRWVSTNSDYQSSKEVCLKAEFEKPVNVDFEGISSQTYSHYDRHLRAYYGNYMELPPESERLAKHDFKAWIGDAFDFNFLEQGND